MENKYPHNDFIIALSKLTPDQLVGTARVLGVNIMTDEKDEKGNYQVRDGQEIVTDMINSYSALNRKQRRNLLKIVKAAK